jgi:dTDP-4-dehydrorhamnose 3,5-epimerase
MTFTETKLKGCFVLEPTIFADDRGYFLESFNVQRFNTGIHETVSFVQDNQSFSNYGTIRAIQY